MDVRSFFGRRPGTATKGRRKVVRKAAPARAVRSVPPRARKAITTLATRVLNRAVETKHAYQTLFETWQPQYGSTIPTGGQAQLYNALFDVNVGATAEQRNGNIIRPITLYNDLQIVINDKTADLAGSGAPLLASAWDITVHVWYGVARRYKSTGDVVGNAPGMLATMWDDQFNPGHQTAFLGKFTDQLNPVNKDAYLLKHKKVRLCKGPGIANTANGLTSQVFMPQKSTAQMRLTWKCPKTLHFNDNEGLPQDFAPFFVIGYVHNDTSQSANSATGGPTIQTKPALLIQASQHLLFKDA